MSSITTRAGKGSPLTYIEVDSNFTNLNSDKIQATNGMGSSGQVLTTDGTNATWATASSGLPTAIINFGANIAYSGTGSKALNGNINQIFSNISSLSIGSNSYNWNGNGSVSNVPYITFPAGSYQILIPAYKTQIGTIGTMYFGDTSTNNQLVTSYSNSTFQQFSVGSYPFFQGGIFTFDTTGTTIIPVGSTSNTGYSYNGILQITKYA